MKNVCEQIDLSIKPKTVTNYFNHYREIKHTDLDQQRHTYFGNINNAYKILTEIQINLHIKKMEEEIKNKKNHTSAEVEKLVEKIEELKSALLVEIDDQEKKTK